MKENEKDLSTTYLGRQRRQQKLIHQAEFEMKGVLLAKLIVGEQALSVKLVDQLLADVSGVLVVCRVCSF